MRPIATAGLLLILTLPHAEASTRWDLLHWCRSEQPLDQARCEGMLQAALDLTTHPDFTTEKHCFPAEITLPGLRNELVSWLEENRVAPEKSGLALLARGISDRYPCPR
ncbi:Rap1a/Tai family immunity protein [Motiliproteus sediminis]|uniref:Rap1a/Tai family immunity protein n=1 Tax=Motiliproteus sediminis TaxID=1468178 RepID=UPI001AEFD954|nr:Rap1a/Tai family immunity protein [Motiliproteus sediminis]